MENALKENELYIDVPQVKKRRTAFIALFALYLIFLAFAIVSKYFPSAFIYFIYPACLASLTISLIAMVKLLNIMFDKGIPLKIVLSALIPLAYFIYAYKAIKSSGKILKDGFLTIDSYE